MVSFKTDFTPEDVAYDGSRITVLNHFFEDLTAKKKIISANYCLARGGKVFANHAVGRSRYIQISAIC